MSTPEPDATHSRFCLPPTRSQKSASFGRGARRVAPASCCSRPARPPTTCSSCSRAKSRWCALEGAEPVVIVAYGPGGFVGELNLLTGQRRSLSCRVTQPGRVLVIAEPRVPPADERRPALAETIFSALLARREVLRAGDGAQAIRIVGSRYSPEAMRLRSFAEHSHLAHAWIDVEEADDADALLASMGSARGRAGGDHGDRGHAPPDAGGVRRASRADVPRRRPATSSTWSSSAAGRPVSPRRCTARRRGCARSRSTPWRSAARPARARGSRTTRAFPTASPAKS